MIQCGDFCPVILNFDNHSQQSAKEFFSTVRHNYTITLSKDLTVCCYSCHSLVHMLRNTQVVIRHHLGPQILLLRLKALKDMIDVKRQKLAPRKVSIHQWRYNANC